MTKRARDDRHVVWTQGPDGWQRVRANVPRSERSEKRSERVPRPPEPRRHGAVAKADAAGASLRELLTIAAVEDIAEAMQRAAREPIVVVAAFLAAATKKKRKRKTRR